MKTLYTLHRWLLVGIAGIVPLFFLSFSAEFYATQKAYLVLAGVVISLVLLGVHVLLSRKFHAVHTPFTRILLGLLAVIGVSTLFAAPNPLGTLFSIPSGAMALAGWIGLYVLTTHTAGVQRRHIPLLEAFVYGALAACAVIIVFYFKPLQNMSLSPELAFLKGTLSPIGNGFETLYVIGFALVCAVGSAIHAAREKHGSRALASVAAIGVTIIAGTMVLLLLFKPAEGVGGLRLPPMSMSWYAALETLKNPTTAMIGAGPGNYDTVFTSAKTAAYNATGDWNINYALSRSLLLNVWVELGILGAGALLILIVLMIRELHGLHQNNDREFIMYALAGAYLIVLLLTFPPSFSSYFMLCVYLIGLAQKSMQYEKEPVTELNLSKIPLAAAGIAAMCLVLAGGIGYFAGRAYAAEYYFKKSIDAIRMNDGQAVYAYLQRAVRMQPNTERYRSQFAQVNLLLANNIARRAEPADTTEENAPAEEASPDTPQLSDQDRQAIAQFIQQAIAEAKALVALNPNRASNWNTLAVIYRNIMNVAEGAQAWTVAAYQEAIKRDPVNPQLYLNLGGVYYGAGDYDAAAQFFQQAVGLKPNWANAHYNLAWAYFQGGKFPEAAAVMRNVLQLIDPESEDYTLAQENLKLFEEEAEKAAAAGTTVPAGQAGAAGPEGATDTVVEATESAEPPVDSEVSREPLTLPATPEAVLSPALKLPEGSGPEEK